MMLAALSVLDDSDQESNVGGKKNARGTVGGRQQRRGGNEVGSCSALSHAAGDDTNEQFRTRKSRVSHNWPQRMGVGLGEE